MEISVRLTVVTIASAMGNKRNLFVWLSCKKMAKYGWGILGSGKIASDFVTSLRHVPGNMMVQIDLICCEDAEVVAVGARSLESAKEFASRFPVYNMAVYGSYKELVSDPKVLTTA
jgi:predicted dehydrogenase